jgi:hypothetical protein
MFQARKLFAVVVFIVPALAVADDDGKRPSADDVASAVARSRAEYAEAHPVPSKEEKLAAIQQELDDTEAGMRKLTGVNSAKTVEQLYSRVKTLKAELARVRRKYTPEIVVRLAAFTNGDLKVGSVGRINDDADQRPVYCVQVLEGDAMLAYIETPHTAGNADSKPDSGTRTVSPTFLLKGANASAATPDRPIKGEFDVVVTGKHSYEGAEGTAQTVFVLEVFNPNRKFE